VLLASLSSLIRILRYAPFFLFFFYSSLDHRHLPSFPTRRSSDLAYPSASAGKLRARTKQRLNYISRLLQGRLTLAQHRELLVTIGWLALLLGCVHYDLGEREQAEAARQAAYQAGLQAGHGEIIAWSYEMAAWFALTEGRYHDVADYAQA